MVLFGGLITIPYWGYRTTPIALLEVMIADLPHVMYHYKEKFTEEQIENRRIVSKDMQNTIKKKGLMGIKDLNLNFNNNVLDGNAIIAKLKQEK